MTELPSPAPDAALTITPARRPVPAWITDPDLIESIELGFMTINDITGDSNG